MYSVKSGYHWLQVREEVERASSSSSGISIRWGKLWNLKIPPKMKIFFWRLLNNALPHNTNLQHRGIQIQNCCARCGETEDLHHVFVGCEWVVVFWFASPLGYRQNLFSSTAFLQWIQALLDSGTDDILMLVITVAGVSGL